MEKLAFDTVEDMIDWLVDQWNCGGIRDEDMSALLDAASVEHAATLRAYDNNLRAVESWHNDHHEGAFVFCNDQLCADIETGM